MLTTLMIVHRFWTAFTWFEILIFAFPVNFQINYFLLREFIYFLFFYLLLSKLLSNVLMYDRENWPVSILAEITKIADCRHFLFFFFLQKTPPNKFQILKFIKSWVWLTKPNHAYGPSAISCGQPLPSSTDRSTPDSSVVLFLFTFWTLQSKNYRYK